LFCHSYDVTTQTYPDIGRSTFVRHLMKVPEGLSILHRTGGKHGRQVGMAISAGGFAARTGLDTRSTVILPMAGMTL
jgi:hypothetical protein